MNKKKLHWFPFYYLDWLSDSSLAMMTYAEKGLFIDMLARCYNEDGLPADNKQLTRLFKCDQDDLTECVKMFYEKDEKLFNKKLDDIKKDQRKISTERSKAGKKSAESRKAKRLTKGTSVEQVLNFVEAKPQQNSTSTVQNSTVQNNKEKELKQKLENDFDIFWADYPKKIKKPKAKSTFIAKVKSGITLERICEAMNKSEALRNPIKKYIPNPQAWLNDDPWDDEAYKPMEQQAQSMADRIKQKQGEL